MAVTIPGAKGSTAITFTVSGSATGNYANDFASAIATQTTIGTLPDESTVAGAAFEYTDSNTFTTVLTTGSQYFYIADSASTLITLAASNETLLIGSLTSVIEEGAVGGERVVFTSGDNLFTGSKTGVGGDTITGGSGNDTIYTGAGPTTVFSGTGDTTIYLQDTGITDGDSTVVGGGDIAVLQSGDGTVYAAGVSDTVFASAMGTVIGEGGKLLIGTSAATLTVVGGLGQVTGALSAGTDITFSSPDSASSAVFTAGAGNETLDGSGAAGGFSFFADTDTVDSSSVTDSVTGGPGADFFSTGTGVEDITAGSGFAGFEIASVAGGTITINDFSGADSVNFAGLSVADETSLLATSSVASGGNLTVTLGDGTTIEFTGITSLSGHLY
jgi:hypothetical protein